MKTETKLFMSISMLTLITVLAALYMPRQFEFWILTDEFYIDDLKCIELTKGFRQTITCDWYGVGYEGE